MTLRFALNKTDGAKCPPSAKLGGCFSVSVVRVKKYTNVLGECLRYSTLEAEHVRFKFALRKSYHQSSITVISLQRERRSNRQLVVAMSLLGRLALVTGGGSGIGRVLCHALANEGAAVVVADIDAASADRTRDELKGLGKGAFVLSWFCQASRGRCRAWTRRALQNAKYSGFLHFCSFASEFFVELARCSNAYTWQPRQACLGDTLARF